jgi:glycopeptide antibiotics resistance protein
MKDIFGIRKALSLSLMLSISIGLMMEIFQKIYFIDRSFDWYDSIANVIGGIIGAYLFLKYEKVFPIFAKPIKD